MCTKKEEWCGRNLVDLVVGFTNKQLKSEEEEWTEQMKQPMNTKKISNNLNKSNINIIFGSKMYFQFIRSENSMEKVMLSRIIWNGLLNMITNICCIGFTSSISNLSFIYNLILFKWKRKRNNKYKLHSKLLICIEI